jgi:hypothetical protein
MPPQRPERCKNQKSGERRHQGPISYLKSDGTGGLCRACGRAGMSNAGATSSGKRTAGKRSGVRRKAKIALVVKKQWIDYILDGSKTWEIRGSATTKRTWVHLAQSGTSKLVGGAQLVDCKHILRSQFMKHKALHRVPSLAIVKYRTIYAWVLRNARRYKKPFEYKHAAGAVIWVRAPPMS